MLSIRRFAVTTAAVAALAAPAAAQARPDIAPGSQGSPDIVTVPQTKVVDAGFDWGDAAIGGGAALLLTAALGGAALTVRPRLAGHYGA